MVVQKTCFFVLQVSPPPRLLRSSSSRCLPYIPSRRRWYSPSSSRSTLCEASTPNGELPSKDAPKLSHGDPSKPAGFGNKMAFVGAETIGISFTCDASGCGERITKSVRRRSYEKGTVLIQCPQCQKHHIIADNYGLYREMTGGRKNIEEIAKASGASCTRVGGDTFEKSLSKLLLDHMQNTNS